MVDVVKVEDVVEVADVGEVEDVAGEAGAGELTAAVAPAPVSRKITVAATIAGRGRAGTCTW